MTLKRRLIRLTLILLLFPPLIAAAAGWLVGPGFLHPIRRAFTPDLIMEADSAFSLFGAQREDFDVRAPDGVALRGWKVRPQHPNASWVLLFHGVADNRIGVLGQAELLLKARYSVVMMDARAHGASDGPMATYGWLERNDTKAVVDALLTSEQQPVSAPHSAASSNPKSRAAASSESFTSFTSSTSSAPHIFALGESMGAGIALQSAGVDPRMEAVVAEASFADLREASYDYAGLRKSPLLGKTLFAPFSWTLIYRGESLAGFPASSVSPEKAVAARPFPVLLICDEQDEALPCRHSERIYAAATGPKQLWKVPGAFHSAALGYQPAEFRRRVLTFFGQLAAANSAPQEQGRAPRSGKEENPQGLARGAAPPQRVTFDRPESKHDLGRP
jgi:alpha-beta hydrolase superfamily lysophospholipase